MARRAPARSSRKTPVKANASSADTCFVIMPFGEKVDLKGRKVKFDDIYARLLAPAIAASGLQPVRCDEVYESGLIQRKMLEYIRDARAAVVDISLLNANVFYELGVRHTLRKSVTVLVRRKGTAVPFNIGSMNVIEYDESDQASVADTRTRIGDFLINGLRGTTTDSLVHELLDLNVTSAAKPITRQQVYQYAFRGRSTAMLLVTGGIENIRGVDVWVNAENTNMQMARFYEWGISSVIRYYGARRDATGLVARSADDLIANVLAAIMGEKLSVPGGTVIPTTAGELLASHGVKAIFHAAAVQGQVGKRYRPVENVANCVTNALQLMDSPALRDRGLTSIAFPLLGAGVEPERLGPIVRELFEAAVSYVERTPDTRIERICFLPWTTIELETCLSQLESFAELSHKQTTAGLTRRRNAVQAFR
jgi:O-acetyl-ADP-ribose deacetylase (regulator of RNase III)